MSYPILMARLGELEDRVQRLESPEGAERPLVPPTRSEKGPGDAEQRSAEGRAVPPGEAQAAVAAAIDALRDEARELRSLARMIRENFGPAGDAKDYMEKAGRFEMIAESLDALLPEPDSGAPMNLAAFEHAPAPKPLKGSARPKGKRSGRRNDKILPAAATEEDHGKRN